MHPPFVVTYGDSGTGKSTDWGYAYPSALFLAAPNALASVESTCGYEPLIEDPKDIADATKIIQDVRKNGGKRKGRKVTAIIPDDFSFLAEQEASKLEKKFSGFKFWGQLRDACLDFRDEARYAGLAVGVNAWKAGPKTDEKGKFTKGGPKLPGDLPSSLPAMCDMALQVVHEPGRKPWPNAYHCYTSPQWSMKDRFSVVPRVAPMNIAEILRLAGFDVPRHPDLPWQEEKVQELALWIDGLGNPELDMPATNEAYAYLLGLGASPAAARWTVRDAIDRVHLYRAKALAEASFTG